MRFEYRYTERPEFLVGVHWLRVVFIRAEHLKHERFLFDDDPWIALAATLEFARSGEWRLTDRLKGIVMDPDNSPTLVSAILDAVACAAPVAELDFLADVMLSASKHTRMAACDAAGRSGILFLVPHILNVWEEITRLNDRRSIENVISRMLECEDPPSGNFTFFDGDYGVAEYKNLVNDALEPIRNNAVSEHPTIVADQICIREGHPVDLHEIIGSMTAILDGTDPWTRQNFQARVFALYTGLNCSKWFSNGDFQPNAARRTLRKLNEDLVFDVGVRYFFGRPVR